MSDKDLNKVIILCIALIAALFVLSGCSFKTMFDPEVIRTSTMICGIRG